MAARWTDEQQRAIDLRHCNILVSAAAGSGKTAVLVERIFSMLADTRHPLNIDNLLVVTFTNAAAAEMKERVEDRLAKSLDESPDNDHVARQLASIHSAQIMTIHSFCLYVIRNHFNEIDLDPAFRIGEETELKLLRGDVAKELMEARYETEDPAFLEFVECFAKGKMDEGIEELILQVYEYSRSYPSPAAWLSGCLEGFRVQAGEDLEKLPAVQFLLAYVRQLIPELKEAIVTATALCQEDDGPIYYEEMLASDAKIVAKLEACESFDDYYQALSDLAFAPLSRKKMPNASEAKKNQVKNLRAFVKDTLTGLKEDYFGNDAKTAAGQLYRMLSHMEMLVSLVNEFSERYQAAKEAKNMVDFGDLEHFALKILTREEEGKFVPTDVALELSKQYEEILIDEYQDSNQVQETILTSISRERIGKPNIFMVGDVKQSIYKFRLAKPELFMEKYKSYPQMDDKYQRIELHKNFRSRDVVLDSVNFLFRRLMAADLGDIDYDDDAALYVGASFPVPEPGGAAQEAAEASLAADGLGGAESGGAAGITWADSCEVLLMTPGEALAGKIDEDGAAGEADESGKSGAGGGSGDGAAGQKAMTAQELEAHGIALRIREMVEGPEPLHIIDKASGEFRPAVYGDIVILLRTMSGWADTFVKVLGEENISAQAETVTGFFSAMEIQIILSYLAVIDNPRQDIPLAAVLRSPIVGLSDEQLSMIASIYGRNSEHRRELYDCCQACLAPEGIPFLEQFFEDGEIAQLRERLEYFFTQLEEMRACVSYTPVHELILKVYDTTGFYAYACAMPGGAARRANMDMLVEKAVDYENTSYRGLFNFARYIDKLKAYEVDFGEAAVADGSANTVRIMSIHKSKGLEYPVVFVAGLGKSFNQQDARSSLIIHSDYGFGPDVIDTKWRLRAPTLQKKILARKTVLENLGEELRVLYVALTRAKEKLVLCGYVEDMEKALERWCQGNDGATVLSFKQRQGARSFLDWIMAVLTRHQSAHKLLEDYGFQSPVFGKDYEDPAPFVIREMDGSSILMSIVGKSAGAMLKKDVLLHWDHQREYLPQMHEEIGHYLGWSYPYSDELQLHTKMTVSELKRIRQMALADGGEDEEFGAFFEDSAAAPEAAQYVTEEPGSTSVGNAATEAAQGEGELTLQERMERAALRGTTVHKILERMDTSKMNSFKDVSDFVASLQESGQIDAFGASLVYVPGIWRFARSGLARRMAKAGARGQLYKEKQFVIGVPPSRIDASLDSEDMVLIQGIIDAWFIEDGEIIIVDYKTDYVPDDGTSLVKRYKAQLDYYGLALEQMTQMTVREKIIYSLGLGKALVV